MDNYHNYEWFTRDDIDWVYVRIKRAGSTWMTEYLLANGFKEIKSYKSYKNHHKLVVLREPLERFMSAVGITTEIQETLLKNPRKALVEYADDPHISLQSRSMQYVDKNNATFIKYEKNWINVFYKFLKERGTKMEVAPPSTWYNKFTPFGKATREKHLPALDENLSYRFYLKSYFDENPGFNKIIMAFLEDDYKLYNKVEWYGTN